jgi:hypothetical protein
LPPGLFAAFDRPAEPSGLFDVFGVEATALPPYLLPNLLARPVPGQSVFPVPLRFVVGSSLVVKKIAEVEIALRMKLPD